MKAKRSLGQNFFVNKNLGNTLIKRIEDTGIDTVVEIGPGMGFFTEKLSQSFKRVTVVEKDTELANTLELQFSNVSVINKDILSIDFKEFGYTNFTFFGSLPYNISKPIIKRVIESTYFKYPSFFIIQKEVADKYIYREPYSILSLTAAIYADCKKILDISPESFRPKPNVNSSYISFTPTEKIINRKDQLEDLITLSFRQPRKSMYNNLKNTVYQKGIDKYKTFRPAQLSLDEYIDILNYSL